MTAVVFEGLSVQDEEQGAKLLEEKDLRFALEISSWEPL